MKKKNTLFIGMLLFGILLSSFASAEFWACFQQGERINYCNNYRASETYSGSYPKCMSVYREAENCYVHGVWPKCNALNPADCTIYNGGGTEFDLTPPKLTILSPQSNGIFNTRKLYLNFSLDERATVYYRDLNKATISWIKVCDKCYPGNPAYAKIRSFAEGNNTLLFKAVDVAGNEAELKYTFFIDSIKPRIYTTTPRTNAFGDGSFTAQFRELNPKKLTLHYGNDSSVVNLNDCYLSMGKMNCDKEVTLNKYDGKAIPYYFEIEDVAGNKYQSRSTIIKVDTTFPVVKNPSSFFKVNGNYVEFNISIDEANLYKVAYIDTANIRATPRTMCTRLTNGYCYKKQSFIRGKEYSLSVQILDKAGHSIALPADFKIN